MRMTQHRAAFAIPKFPGTPPDCDGTMRIAILDHDRDQATLVCETLSALGYACKVFPRREELLAHARSEGVDLLIADAATPDIAALPAAIDTSGGALPLLLLTERTSIPFLMAALDAGLTDYLVKPLRRGELAMRVRILLQRAYPEREAMMPLRFGQYAFDLPACRLILADRTIALTRKEFELALLFFRNLGRPLSRAYILETIWSRDADLPSRTVDTHVSRVRSKLGLRPERGFRLVPVYSYGYQLEQLSR